MTATLPGLPPACSDGVRPTGFIATSNSDTLSGALATSHSAVNTKMYRMR